MTQTTEPLGGVAVPGFGPWIRDKAAEVARTAQILREKHPDDSPARILGEESHLEYAAVLTRWNMVGRDGAMDQGAFESYLVEMVVHSAHTLKKARAGQSGGYPTVFADAAHGRACLFMARYLGIPPERIRRCGTDRMSIVATAGVR